MEDGELLAFFDVAGRRLGVKPRAVRFYLETGEVDRGIWI